MCASLLNQFLVFQSPAFIHIYTHTRKVTSQRTICLLERLLEDSHELAVCNQVRHASPTLSISWCVIGPIPVAQMLE